MWMQYFLAQFKVRGFGIWIWIWIWTAQVNISLVIPTGMSELTYSPLVHNYHTHSLDNIYSPRNGVTFSTEIMKYYRSLHQQRLLTPRVPTIHSTTVPVIITARFPISGDRSESSLYDTTKAFWCGLVSFYMNKYQKPWFSSNNYKNIITHFQILYAHVQYYEYNYDAI